MSARLATEISLEATDPSQLDTFFSKKTEIPVIEKFSLRECPDVGKMPPPCSVNLSFGFFFDGTNNNLQRDLATNNHSNVARLYLAFPGGDSVNPWPQAKTDYPH